MKLVSKKSFQLTNSSGETSHTCPLKNGIPQGARPNLIEYTRRWPATYFIQNAYIICTYRWFSACSFPQQCRPVSILASDLEKIYNHYHQWRMKVSESKATSSIFYSTVLCWGGLLEDRHHLQKLHNKIAARTSSIHKLQHPAGSLPLAYLKPAPSYSDKHPRDTAGR